MTNMAKHWLVNIVTNIGLGNNWSKSGLANVTKSELVNIVANSGLGNNCA